MSRLLEVARRIDTAQERAGLMFSEEHSLQFELIPAVLDWAQGDVSPERRAQAQGMYVRVGKGGLNMGRS